MVDDAFVKAIKEKVFKLDYEVHMKKVNNRYQKELEK
jgi:hypothetical protein